MAWDDPPTPYEPWTPTPPPPAPAPEPLPQPASPGLSNGAKIVLGILAMIVGGPILEGILNSMGTAGTVIEILIIPAAIVIAIIVRLG